MNNSLTLKQKQRDLLTAKRDALKVAAGVNYVPHGQQAAFHAAGNAAQERLFLAGNRCGKTLCGAYEMAMHLTGLYPAWWVGVRFDKPIQAWAASVTTEATRDILQRAYVGDARRGAVGAIPAHLLGRISMKRGVSDAMDEVYVKHVSGAWSVLGFKSYDQGREKFQGTARHMVHLDEEPEIEIYEECLLRTATVSGHMLLTMTPLKGMTALCARFLEGAEHAGKAVIRAGWDDAPHLNAADKNRLRASLRPHEVAARERGEPSLSGGLVFPVPESQFVVERFEIPPHFKRVYGVDFGWTNPTAMVWAAYDAEHDVVYLHDSYSQSEGTPAMHAEAIQARGAWIPGVCDPAGQSAGVSDGASVMELYARHGIHLQQADNSVEAGLMEMLERLRDGRLKVFSDMHTWLAEYRMYRRDSKGKIVKSHDHLLDATRYLIRTGLPLARTKPAASMPRVRADWRVV
ncbi:MAG: terminase family protein [Alphaproteobacteria bacterium]